MAFSLPKPVQKKRKASSSDAGDATQAVSGAKQPKKKAPPNRNVPDCEVTNYLELLPVTETKSDKNKEIGQNMTVAHDSFEAPHVATASPASAIGSDEEEPSQDASQDEHALGEATRTNYGVLRKKLLNVASKQSVYAREGKSLAAGTSSKVYYTTNKTKKAMTEIPADSETLWKILNELRKPQDSVVTLCASVGAKDDNDFENIAEVESNEDALLLSEKVKPGDVELHSPGVAVEVQSLAARRAASHSCDDGCREWLLNDLKDSASPIRSPRKSKHIQVVGRVSISGYTS